MSILETLSWNILGSINVKNSSPFNLLWWRPTKIFHVSSYFLSYSQDFIEHCPFAQSPALVWRSLGRVYILETVLFLQILEQSRCIKSNARCKGCLVYNHRLSTSGLKRALSMERQKDWDKGSEGSPVRKGKQKETERGWHDAEFSISVSAECFCGLEVVLTCLLSLTTICLKCGAPADCLVFYPSRSPYYYHNLWCGLQ